MPGKDAGLTSDDAGRGMEKPALRTGTSRTCLMTAGKTAPKGAFEISF
jgi:hypothetical protein